MIVKNETQVLARLFNSLKDIIDYYIIVDTGSNDGTPELIKSTMDALNIDGEVHQQPWVNFGYNRNQALQLVYKKNYQGWVLFIDADEEFAVGDPAFFQKLKAGLSYRLEKHHRELRYSLPNLVDVSQTHWEWRGVVHEYLQHISGPDETHLLTEAWIIYHEGEGARSQGVSEKEKFLRDAALLEKECKKNPNDTRSQFYLAQSYHHAGQDEKAYQHYLLRAQMQGWVEEDFIALLRAGQLAIQLNKSYQEILDTLLRAHQLRPTRAEALHELAVYHRQLGRYAEAYGYAKQASLIPLPNDRLFVQADVYAWKVYDEFAVAAYWIGDYQASKESSELILKKHNEKKINLDQETLARLNENLNYAVQKLDG